MQAKDIGASKEGVDASKGWTVVNRSPNKKVASSHTNLESEAETIRCTNSFDALANAQQHGENDAGKSLEFIDGKSVVEAGQNCSPGSGKQ